MRCRYTVYAGREN